MLTSNITVNSSFLIYFILCFILLLFTSAILGAVKIGGPWTRSMIGGPWSIFWWARPGPWTRSTEGVHGPGVHVFYFPSPLTDKPSKILGHGLNMFLHGPAILQPQREKISPQFQLVRPCSLLKLVCQLLPHSGRVQSGPQGLQLLKNLTHPLCITRSISRSAIIGAPESRQTSIENFDPFPSGVLCFKQDKS